MIVPFAGCLIRKNIRKHASCFSLSIQNVIQTLLKMVGDQEKVKAYSSRKKDFQVWLEGKAILNPEVDQLVDVRDTEDIWCIGIIKGIYSNQNHSKTLLIHYKGKFNQVGTMCMMNLSVKILPDLLPLATSL